MPGSTSKYNFTTFLETDYVDWDSINDNFEKIDDFTLCTSSGTASSSYTGGASGSTTWQYKVYADNTFEMSTTFGVTIACSTAVGSLYQSSSIQLSLPSIPNKTIASLTDLQFYMSSSTVGWIVDITNTSGTTTTASPRSFEFVSVVTESSDVYKKVFVSVKGVVS